jgi:anion transporter
MGCKPRSILLAVVVANFALAPLSPSTTAKAFLLLPIIIGLADAFRLEKGKSRFGAALFLTAMASNNIASTAFLTATVPNPITAGYLAELGVSLDWFGWLRMALPFTAIILAISLLLVLRLLPPEVDAGAETVRKVCSLRDDLGPLSRSEKLTAVIFAGCFVLWMLERSLPFNAGVASLLISLLLLVPGFGVLEAKGFSSQVPYGSILLFAASMFLARSVGSHRALDPVANGLFQLFNLDALGSTVFTWAIVFGAMLLHAAFTSTTAYATVMVPLVAGLYKLQGLDPVFGSLAVGFLTPIAVILPVNTIPNIVFHEEGWFTERQMLVYGVALSFLSALLVILLGQPYWKLLGFIP